MNKITKRIYKPRDFGLVLDIHPTKITKLAKDIEEQDIYQFEKTMLGSYLFQKEDIKIIKEYHELLVFFKRKNQALQKLDERVKINNLRNKKKRPIWFQYIVSKKNI